MQETVREIAETLHNEEKVSSKINMIAISKPFPPRLNISTLDHFASVQTPSANTIEEAQHSASVQKLFEIVLMPLSVLSDCLQLFYFETPVAPSSNPHVIALA